jgi:hypothetical protein
MSQSLSNVYVHITLAFLKKYNVPYDERYLWE